MTNEDLITKIKSRGYWEVRITPATRDPSLIPERGKLFSILDTAQVRLRGWYYPHIGHWDKTSLQRPIMGPTYIEGGSDWNMQIEFWRFTQSGQFIHLFAMDEDYMQESTWYQNSPDLKNIAPGKVLDTGSVIYTVSEIFAFVEGLARQGIYENGVKIEISLKGTQGRILKVFDPRKVELFMEYKCGTPYVNWSRTLTKDEVLNEYKKIAIDTIDWIFESFNWINRPREVFEADQNRLFERRL